MANSYEFCPCGSGEKIKHCCARPLQNEMNKILDLLAEGQRAAASQRIEKGLRDHPRDPCLTALKAQLKFPDTQRAADSVGEVAKLKQELRDVAPEHPVTLALELLSMHMQQLRPGATEDSSVTDTGLQENKAKVFEQLIGRVREMKSVSNFVHSALRATLHAHEQTDITFEWVRAATFDHICETPDGEASPSEAIVESLPSLLRDDILSRFVNDAQSGEGDAEAFVKLVERALEGQWTRVAGDIEALLSGGDHRAEYYGLMAWVRTGLSQREEAATWWNRYASHPDVKPLSAAIALYIATMLEQEPKVVIETAWELKDYTTAAETMIASRRLMTSSNLSPNYSHVFSPPPRLTIQVLDRPAPSVDEVADTPFQDLPKVLAAGLVFGKETDREPRILLSAQESYTEPLSQILHEELGDEVTGPIEIGRGTAFRPPLFDPQPAWLPEQLDLQRRREKQQEGRQWLRHEGGLDLPSPLLQGKTARQAAEAEVEATRREAFFIAFQVTMSGERDDIDGWAQIREVLGLPAIAQVAPDDVLEDDHWNLIPYADWTSADFGDIMRVALKSLELQFDAGIMTCSEEILRRSRSAENVLCDEELAGLVDVLFNRRLDALGPGEPGLAFTEQVVEAADRIGVSEGLWLVNRWVLAISSADETTAEQTWLRLQGHLDDPNVAMRVQSVLVQMGLINPDGSVNRPPSQMADGPPAAAEPSGVWTPGGAPAESEAPSKLWLPGQE